MRNEWSFKVKKFTRIDIGEALEAASTWIRQNAGDNILIESVEVKYVQDTRVWTSEISYFTFS